MTQIYVVINHTKVVGASHRLQGAEEIRTDEATRLADETIRSVTCGIGLRRNNTRWQNEYRIAYDLMTIHPTNLQDDE